MIMGFMPSSPSPSSLTNSILSAGSPCVMNVFRKVLDPGTRSAGSCPGSSGARGSLHVNEDLSDSINALTDGGEVYFGVLE